MPLEALTVLSRSCYARHEVKRSLFEAFAEPLESPDQVDALLEKHRDREAGHHCWAWRCDGRYRFSDDGEPAGTAGRPMLQAIEGADIERVLVIVRRYFGGIKLGAGGLVRAYSAATSACLRTASLRQLVPHVQLTLRVPFEHTQALFSVLGDSLDSPPQHSSRGASVSLLVPANEVEQVSDNLRNQTRGQIEIQRGEKTLA